MKINSAILLMIAVFLWGCGQQKTAEQTPAATPQQQGEETPAATPQPEEAPAAAPRSAPEQPRTTRAAEPAFEGYYVFTDEGNLFYECATGKIYWVTGDQEMLSYLRQRYVDTVTRAKERVYVQFRGEKSAGAGGDIAEYDGLLTVKAVVAFRKKQEGDCDFPRRSTRGTARPGN